MKPHGTFGVTLCGSVLIASSLFQMLFLIDPGYYWKLFPASSTTFILIRYGVSWLLRIVGFIAGVGIVRREERCRKLAIALFWAVILTVYWKHTYGAMYVGCQSVERAMNRTALLRYGVPYLQTMTSPSFVWASVIVERVLDSVVAGWFIYYLTRPRVKAAFKGAGHGFRS